MEGLGTWRKGTQIVPEEVLGLGQAYRANPSGRRARVLMTLRKQMRTCDRGAG